MNQQQTLRLPEQNSVILVGRLTRDPEVRFTAKGMAVCSLDIAVNRRYKSTSGEWKDDATFISVVVWGDSATRCGEKLKKGSPVHVEGRLQSRAWETKEGQKRTTIEVVARRVQFLTRSTEASAAGEGTASAVEEAAPSAETSDASTTAEEEVPF